jgi:hypothetical protein
MAPAQTPLDPQSESALQLFVTAGCFCAVSKAGTEHAAAPTSAPASIQLVVLVILRGIIFL